MSYSRGRNSAQSQQPGRLGQATRSTRRRLLAAVEQLEPRQLLAGLDPYISEFLAENDDLLILNAPYVDQDGDRSDWIEIHNPAPTAVNLAGWRLTDNRNKLDKWTLPNLPLPANGYVVIFASDKRRAIPGQEQHTNFKLDWQTGEYLALVKPDGTIASEFSPTYPPQTADVSYGQAPASVTTTKLVSTGAPAAVLIPSSDALGTTWTNVGFDTTGWASATTGVGYEFSANTALPTEIESNNTIGTANSAVYNFSTYVSNYYHNAIRGDLGITATSTDIWNIGSLQKNDALTISLAGSASRGAGFYNNPLFELYRGNAQTQTLVASDDQSGMGADALLAQYAITTTDNYYVKVTKGASDSSSGLYNLSLWLDNIGTAPLTGASVPETENNNTFGTADDGSANWRAIQYLSRTAGSISTTTDTDVFAYQFTKDDRVTINIDSTSTLDAKVALFNSAGTAVAAEDGSSVFPAPYDKDSPIYVYVVPTSGIYHVQVQSASGTGSYNADVYLSTASPLPTSTGWITYGGKIAIAGNIGPQMKDGNASAYVRLPFAAVDAATINALTLRIDYDDGFIAYLNGTPVASANAPSSPTYNSAATGSHQAAGFVEFDITSYKHLLLAEDESNVLAIHGLNESAADADFVIVAELVATAVIPSSPQYFASPTPGQVNQPGALGVVADTKFSHNRGFYDTPFDVVISTSTSNAQIRYTLDGSAPTATSGTVYTAPIHISKTTTLRAAAFKAGYVPTNVDTQTYIFLDDILTQTGAGFPIQWVGTATTTADYAVDPAVVAANAATIKNDLKSLPVVSLVTSMDNWFGPNGVGIYPQGVAIERPVSVEYFKPDGSNDFQINGGVQIVGGGIGGTSAQRWKSYKLSMRVMFKNIYGPGELNHDIFGSDATDQFDTLVLDAHLNHTWTHPATDQQTTARFLTDTFVSDSQNSMGGTGPHSQFVHLYLNGLYWGMYDLHERPDEHFAEDYFGGQGEDYDVIKHGLQHGGEAIVNGDPLQVNADYQTLVTRVSADLTIPANYELVEQILDIDDFIDYMIANHYAGNEDWTNKNWYATYNRVDPNGKWRFHSWDAEHTLESLGTNVTDNTTTNHPRGIHDMLKRSPDYRMRFADRVQKHFLTPGGTFYVDPANPAWDPAHPERNMPAAAYFARMTEIDRAIVGESARWGDNRRPGNAYTRDNWLATQNAMLTGYFPQRSTTVLNQYKSASNLLYPSINAPGFSSPGGQFANPQTLTLSKSGAGTIYYTTDGSDPRLPGGALNPAARPYTSTISIPKSSLIQARILDGATWSALTNATFLIGPPPALRISEIMYHPLPPTNSPFLADDFEFIELQNVGSSVLEGDFTLSGAISGGFTLAQQLEPGDRIVLTNNLAAFEERYGDSIYVTGVYGGRLGNDGARVILSTGLGQVVQDITYSDAWYSHTDGEGFSLVAINPAANSVVLNSKSGWRPNEPLHGTPGSPDPGYNPGDFVINEVYTSPTPGGDWIEIHNTTNYPITLTNWFLSNTNQALEKFKIPASLLATVPAHGYFVFNEADIGFGLGDRGDRVFLSSNYGGLAGGYRESVDFGVADPGLSFGRYVKSTGESDFAALASPTPNQPNSIPRIGPIVISEIMYHPAIDGDEFVELQNITADAVPLYDTANPANGWRFTDGIAYTFTANDIIPAGAGALVVGIVPATFRTKYNIPAQVQIFGPYTKLLENLGEKLELSKPGTPQPDAFVPLIVVDRVHYDNIAPWPTTPDGGGASLARIRPTSYANDVVNWTALPDGGTPGLVIATDSTPPTATITPVPSPRDTTVASITIIFSEPVTGFTRANLTLSHNGNPVSLTSQTLTPGPDGKTYTLGNLAPLTWIEGDYTLSLSPAGITDLAYNPLANAPSETFTMTTTILAATNPGDTFYFRVAGTVLQIFTNTEPTGVPTYTWPLASLSTFNLVQGTYYFTSDLAGLNITVAGSDPANPTTLFLNTTQHLASLSINSNARVGLTPGSSKVLRTNSLAITGNGVLDLADNDLILQSATPAADLSRVFAFIKSARGTGTWAGPGLTTTKPSSNASLALLWNDKGGNLTWYTHFASEPVNASSILVKYAWNGDANLDGVVNADDYFLIDSGFVSRRPGYQNGDFNYDSVINADDYFLIDSAFIGQSGPLGSRTSSGPNAIQPPPASPDSGNFLYISYFTNIAPFARTADSEAADWLRRLLDPKKDSEVL